MPLIGGSMIAVSRPPGRPPLDPNDRSVPIQVRVPSREWDEIYQRSRRDRLTMPEYIRLALREHLKRADSEPR